MSDLGLARQDVVITPLALGHGVEAGQLSIVGVGYVVLIWWARQPWYLHTARAGSTVILLVAGWWLYQCVFVG